MLFTVMENVVRKVAQTWEGIQHCVWSSQAVLGPRENYGSCPLIQRGALCSALGHLHRLYKQKGTVKKLQTLLLIIRYFSSYGICKYGWAGMKSKLLLTLSLQKHRNIDNNDLPALSPASLAPFVSGRQARGAGAGRKSRSQRAKWFKTPDPTCKIYEYPVPDGRCPATRYPLPG